MILSKRFSQIQVWALFSISAMVTDCLQIVNINLSLGLFKLLSILKNEKIFSFVTHFFLQLPSFLYHSHILTDICWKDDKLKDILCVVTWLLLGHNIYLRNVKNTLLTQHSSWHLWKVIRTYLYLHSVNTAGKILLPERLHYLYFL